jgi:hypothetical protein
VENWGLVTYREAALLIDPVTASSNQKQRVAVVVTHELAHQYVVVVVVPSGPFAVLVCEPTPLILLVVVVAVRTCIQRWFGNLVTMAWWDDLWLNEGFASWAENWATVRLFTPSTQFMCL